MPSGGGGGGTTTTVQKTDPPAYALPFLEEIAQQAQGLYQGPGQQFFPGSTVVGFSPQTMQALQMMEQQATAGSPLIDAAQQSIQQTAAGDFLAPNPYFEEAAAASARPLLEQYSEVIAPTLSAQFARAGRSGSPAAERVQLSAAEDLSRTLADEYAQQAFANYSRERQNQLQASQLAPSLEQAGYLPAQQLAGVGQAYENLSAAQLQEDINRFNFAQNEPYNALAQYAQFINSTNPGAFGAQTGSVTQPSAGIGSGIIGGAGLGYGAGSFLGGPLMTAAMGGVPIGGFGFAPFLGPAGAAAGGLLGGMFA